MDPYGYGMRNDIPSMCSGDCSTCTYHYVTATVGDGGSD